MNKNYLNSYQDDFNAIKAIINHVVDGRSKIELGKVIAVYKDKKQVDIQPL